MMQRHMVDILAYLFDRGQHFGILCKIDDVSFDPPLPEYMQDGFAHLTLFFLAGYTYESAVVEQDRIVFEAGFGQENFGSVVSVPLLSIVQVIVDETPIFINLAEAAALKEERTNTAGDVDPQSVENSMSVFLSNPENEKFFKK